MDFLDFFLNFDDHLATLVENLGWLSYGLLFAIIFCETGLVFTPFLPGDSLIFVAATLAAQGVLNAFILWLIFMVACITGDSVNYWVGLRFGRRLSRSGSIRPEYLERTERFYEKHGKKTIILARFIPIVRTFAPFVAGMAQMNYRDFIVYNVGGGFFWVTFFVGSGYFFGELSWVQDNLHFVILFIIFLSLMPPLWEHWRTRKR